MKSAGEGAARPLKCSTLGVRRRSRRDIDDGQCGARDALPTVDLRNRGKIEPITTPDSSELTRLSPPSAAQLNRIRTADAHKETEMITRSTEGSRVLADKRVADEDHWRGERPTEGAERCERIE